MIVKGLLGILLVIIGIPTLIWIYRMIFANSKSVQSVSYYPQQPIGYQQPRYY